MSRLDNLKRTGRKPGSPNRNKPIYHPILPIVRDFFDLQARLRLTDNEIASSGGKVQSNISLWRRGQGPSLKTFVRILDRLGYRLTIVPKEPQDG